MATAPSTPAMSARRFSVPTSVRGIVLDEEEAAKIPIPSAFPAPPHVEATPLPWLSLSVLAITVMGEFLCANVSTPFLLFMVRGFGVGEDEAEVGYWTGILVSVFFLTQFATSLIWASLADNFGRRNILFISLLGSSVTCTVFGTQKTFQYALGVRLIQGVFAGAIGVARSAVGSITDSSNEGRAYAIMGFAWGLGGVIGAVIGGTFESPAQKWPALFDRFGFLKTHPYLLPCAMAASVTLAGAVMCLLLDRDARPRQSDTPSDTDTDTSITIPTSGSPFLSPSKGVPLPARVEILSRDDGVAGTRPFGIPIPARVDSPRGQTAISFAPEQRIGSSLSGSPMMGGGRRRSSATSRMGMNTPLANRLWTHRRSSAAQPEAPEMNFAERLIAANENQVTSMAQLWVDAAIRTDVPFSEQVEENALEFDSDDELDTPDIRHGSRVLTGPRPSIASERTPLLFRPSREQLSPGTPQRPPVHRSDSSSTVIYPAIFANPGVEAPAEEVVVQPVLLPGGIEAIQEERQSMASDEDLEMQMMEPAVVQQPSALKQIPALVVLQYGLLALHTTTHDQVFYSYLMSRYEAGGLGLSAVHFSQLIAIMSVAQVIYQFYLYPNIGPPRGSFSHLSMFRLGSLLFIPSYATVVMYRGWPEGWVMPGLIASTAVRFCGNTFAFTSITILLNYMTPPSAVGLANGLAQSIASLARFIGPALGAKLWEQSVKYDPSGYALGFWVCSVVCSGALLASWMIR